METESKVVKTFTKTLRFDDVETIIVSMLNERYGIFVRCSSIHYEENIQVVFGYEIVESLLEHFPVNSFAIPAKNNGCDGLRFGGLENHALSILEVRVWSVR